MAKDDLFDYDEKYSQDSLKWHRKERKSAEARDRSKYKKSDQDQIKKLQAQAEQGGDDLFRGHVLKISPEGVTVCFQDQIYQCTLKGSLKKEKGRIKNLVAVGDYVRFQPAPGLNGQIWAVEERTSILSRADNLSRNKEQLIAVNIDQVLITASVLLPHLKLPLIDRYIIAALKGNMQPIIVINKIDLLTSPPPEVALVTVEEERAIYELACATYEVLSIPIFPVSAETGEGIEALKEIMQGKTSVFSGQSGTGKSSLINRLIGTDFATAEIVSKTGKGAHTTTTTQLVPLGGGFCVDTPGIKSFGLWDLQQEEIEAYFTEIAAAASDCKFPDCRHLQEPGCAVKLALEEGTISPLRFASYSALMSDLSQKHQGR